MNPSPEIPLKQWVMEESAKCGLSRSGIFSRIYRGKYRIKLRRINQRVIKVRACVLCVLCVLCVRPSHAMDHFAALGMLESGNNDHAVGPAGEITRYQIRPDVWRVYASGTVRPACESEALAIAQKIMHDRVSHFIAIHCHQPTNLEWYLLWNCPGDIAHPSRKELSRAQRFANLCSRKS